MSDVFASFEPKKEFFIGVDSDGCVFDSMEIKWKECFTPMAIKYWGLQSVAKYAREAIEFVNLYSQDRGVNRWPGVVNAVDWLAQNKEAMLRKPKLPAFTRMRRWIKEAPVHSNAALEELIKAEPDNEEMRNWLAWSKAVNGMIKDIVYDLPPFPTARPSLEKASEECDLVVVSGTPTEALEREWEENGLRHLVRLICGQELGKKSAHLKGCAGNGRYKEGHVLMIGDAPGDWKAAVTTGVLFYPIIPGEEEACWQLFYEEALGLFWNGKYAGAYADHLLKRFNERLPEKPSWVTSTCAGCAGCKK